ncbi:MAG: ABC transporter ATP-binding protein [Alphaproteobacteria bacterium]|nr:ABC transporter ATP-binding protein [Alphaproteobacteria bacterium]
MKLEVQDLVRRFGNALALDGASLDANSGEIVALLGPSGCGKTTLLRIVAGLVLPDRGRVTLAGADITDLPPHKRDVGVVFQNYALFPHLDVAGNVAYGLRAQRRPEAEIKRIVERMLALVHLSDFAGRSVRGLSGGQQQRVAVARALAVEPKLLLLDEPFSALDRKLREAMQIDLRRLLRDVGTTAIFVTHDQDEALVMSDRIAVMNEGRFEQIDAPAALYDKPKTAFALDFVGRSTRLSGKVAAAANGALEIDTAIGRLRAPGNFLPGSPVVVGIRPEKIGFRPVTGPANAIRARVSEIVFQGSLLTVHFRTGDGDRVLLEAPHGTATPFGVGEEATLHLREADTLVFPAA